MNASALGKHFEAEIREQPAVWRRIASSDRAALLANALDGEVVLVGSGSSLFAAQLGALALRRRRISAHALAATEARLDHAAYERRIVVAVSQSGRSSDILRALDVLQPRRLVALTNVPDSPLAARADVVVDAGAGVERAVPASKSVSATAAILLWAASLVAGDGHRDARMLQRVADDVEVWFGTSGERDVAEAGHRLALRSSAVVLGSDYGLPIARETALKLKEACYLHAEGFAAGEFRHGSVAMVDAASAVIGIVDDDAFDVVARPLREVAAFASLRYTLGSRAVDDVPRLGPEVEEPFNTLAWLAGAQLLALHAARTRRVDADVPRGLAKALVSDEPGA